MTLGFCLIVWFGVAGGWVCCLFVWWVCEWVGWLLLGFGWVLCYGHCGVCMHICPVITLKIGWGGWCWLVLCVVGFNACLFGVCLFWWFVVYGFRLFVILLVVLLGCLFGSEVCCLRMRWVVWVIRFCGGGYGCLMILSLVFWIITLGCWFDCGVVLWVRVW